MASTSRARAFAAPSARSSARPSACLPACTRAADQPSPLPPSLPPAPRSPARSFGFEHNANGGFLNHVCWDANVRPFLDMTIAGVIYYQVSRPKPGALNRSERPPAPATSQPTSLPRNSAAATREW